MKGWIYFIGILAAVYFGIYGWKTDDRPPSRSLEETATALFAEMPDGPAKSAVLQYQTMGQAMKCGMSAERLAGVMVYLEAIIKATAPVPSLSIDTGMKLLKLGMAKQGEPGAPPCAKVMEGIERLEEMRRRL